MNESFVFRFGFALIPPTNELRLLHAEERNWLSTRFKQGATAAGTPARN